MLFLPVTPQIERTRDRLFAELAWEAVGFQILGTVLPPVLIHSPWVVAVPLLRTLACGPRRRLPFQRAAEPFHR